MSDRASAKGKQAPAGKVLEMVAAQIYENQRNRVASYQVKDGYVLITAKKVQ